MDRVQEFIDDVLVHYSSQYYNPAKAHEYYLRNRELVGRSVGKLKSTKKKEAWTYAKNQIDLAKKQELKSASVTNVAIIKQLHDNADAKRQELSAKIKLLFEKISKDTTEQTNKLSEVQKQENKRISEEATSKIAALPPIPKGISKEQHAELASKRAEEVARIRGDAKKESDALGIKVTTDRNNSKKSAREATSAQREVVNSELKASIEKARTAYQSLKENLIAKYEQKAQAEYDAIKLKV